MKFGTVIPCNGKQNGKTFFEMVTIFAMKSQNRFKVDEKMAKITKNIVFFKLTPKKACLSFLSFVFWYQ